MATDPFGASSTRLVVLMLAVWLIAVPAAPLSSCTVPPARLMLLLTSTAPVGVSPATWPVAPMRSRPPPETGASRASAVLSSTSCVAVLPLMTVPLINSKTVSGPLKMPPPWSALFPVMVQPLSVSL